MHSSDISPSITAYDKMPNVVSHFHFHMPPGADGPVKAICRHCSVVRSGHKDNLQLYEANQSKYIAIK